MRSKGILKLNYNDRSRNLNYITKPNGNILIITSGNSDKIAYMKAYDSVQLAFGKEVVSARPMIIEDAKEVQARFDLMTENDNNHFSDYKDHFVAVEFKL